MGNIVTAFLSATTNASGSIDIGSIIQAIAGRTPLFPGSVSYNPGVLGYRKKRDALEIVDQAWMANAAEVVPMNVYNAIGQEMSMCNDQLYQCFESNAIESIQSKRYEEIEAFQFELRQDSEGCKDQHQSCVQSALYRFYPSEKKY